LNTKAPTSRLGNADDARFAHTGRLDVLLLDSPLPSPPHLDDLECFAELERLPFGQLFRTVPHP